jgi:hypothetical protein
VDARKQDARRLSQGDVLLDHLVPLASLVLSPDRDVAIRLPNGKDVLPVARETNASKLSSVPWSEELLKLDLAVLFDLEDGESVVGSVGQRSGARNENGTADGTGDGEKPEVNEVENVSELYGSFVGLVRIGVERTRLREDERQCKEGWECQREGERRKSWT